MNEDRSILNALEKARSRGRGAALATVVKIAGSSYRRPGAKMLITEEGDIAGAVSGGCLERDLIQRARLAINRSEPRMVRYDTRVDENKDGSFLPIQSAGLGCEGIIDIFINPA